MGSGFSLDWIDQEWIRCARSSSRTCSPAPGSTSTTAIAHLLLGTEAPLAPTAGRRPVETRSALLFRRSVPPVPARKVCWARRDAQTTALLAARPRLTGHASQPPLASWNAMRQHGLAWLLALPLVTAGSLASHTLAYRLAEPVAGVRSDLLQATGHGYMAAAPFFLAVGIAFLVAGLLRILTRSRAGAATAPPCWPLAFVAPLGFAVQEHLERLVAAGSFPLDL